MQELKINIKRKIIKSFITILIIIIFVFFSITIMTNLNKTYYSANDFNIKTIYSSTDFNKDKIDDYTAFVLGARKDAENKPTYISKYYENGYPPDNEGVCTDVIWRAFKFAGYSLKDMVDNDIKNFPEDYPDIINRDANIDFRRVANLKIYFNKYAENLTTNIEEIENWQPGDIVIFKDKHIGIISDRRNKKGQPYVIHNNGQLNREEDYLTNSEVTGHYRFDASKIPDNLLIKWQN